MAKRKHHRRKGHSSWNKKFGAASRRCMAERHGSWGAFGKCMRSELKRR